MASNRIDLVVPSRHVKSIKTALEEQGLLDRQSKITPFQEEKGPQQRMLIPTTLPHAASAFQPGNQNGEGAGNRNLTSHLEGEEEQEENLLVVDDHLKQKIIQQLSLSALAADVGIHISISHSGIPNPTNPDCKPRHQNPLTAALISALQTLPNSLLGSLDLTPEDLAHAFPATYSIYKPMLLLPAHALSSAPWKKLAEKVNVKGSEEFTNVWRMVAKSMGVRNIAINSGIPVIKSSSTPRSKSTQALGKEVSSSLGQQSNPLNDDEKQKEEDEENVLRAPLHLTPLYGAFGPPPTPARQMHPTAQDFEDALWVETVQNGISQVWAPLYTMFSRGNIREKSRILNLESVRGCVPPSLVPAPQKPVISEDSEAPDQVTRQDEGATALDLYAGIGYFAFCYRRAGIRKVLCWELNPWSVEGLRRGAARNRWRTAVVEPPPRSPPSASGSSSAVDGTDWKTNDLLDSREVQEADFVVFRDTNENALEAIAYLAWGEEKRVLPIRHVNCGFLPSSSLSWRTAVRAVDSEMGGWIHAHENVGVEDIETRRGEVERVMQRYLDEWEAVKGCEGGLRRRVRCEHVERVKTYAPGVMHVVFDIRVDERRYAEEKQ
jgi:tRNA wybutosine-synthesizing protein 2